MGTTPDDPKGRALREVFEAQSGAHDPAERARVERWVAGGDRGATGDARPEEEAERARLDAIWDAPVQKSRGRDGRARAWVLGALALAATAVIAVGVALPGDEPAWREKGVTSGGDIALQLGVRRGDNAFVYGGGDVLVTGDRIGLFLTAPRAGHLVVVYRDSEGAMVRLFPRDSDRSVAVPAGREVRLDAGAILTPAHGCEHVIAAFQAEPFSAAEVEAELRSALGRRQGCDLGPMPTGGRRYQVVTIQR